MTLAFHWEVVPKVEHEVGWGQSIVPHNFSGGHESVPFKEDGGDERAPEFKHARRVGLAFA